MPAFVARQSPVVHAAAAARTAVDRAFSALGLALGSIFFLPRPWIGLVLWLAFLRDPRYAAFALLGLAIGAATKRILRISDGPGLGGGVKANALLAAIVTGWMTGSLGLPWSLQLLLAGAAAIPAALVAAALMRVLANSVMPALLWGYCLVAAMLFGVCPHCTVLAANAMPAWPQPIDALGWGMSFLRSMASLMYSADPGAGVFVCLAILLWSRIMFVCGLVGWISGTLVATGFQSLHLAYYWLPLSYNYFIAGMALGAVVFVPGRLSLAVAAVAGSLTAFFGLTLQYGLNWSATSYLPISSSLAIWVGIGALTLAGDRSRVARNTLQELSPEERWWQVAFWTARFGAYAPLFAVPLAGELQISQGFSGRLSHQGAFRHALDFQRPHSADASAGSIWGAAVTSPVAGTVDRVRNTVPDNALGVCNYAEKWGNYVVIRLDAGGGWALLAHLQQGSVAVAVGSRVETGSYLGRVGNSGRSSVPHLHVHLQDSAEPGAPTSVFRLANYQCATQPHGPLRAWKAAGIPAEGEVVMAARNTAAWLTLTGIAPGSAVWVAESSGRVPRAFRPRGAGRRTHRVDVLLDSLGQHVFDAGSEGKLTSRLDPDAWRVVELSRMASPILRLLALAAPSVPYSARAGMVWNDLAPTLPAGGFLRPLALLLAPYLPHAFLRVGCACVSEPGPGGGTFEIASHPERRSSALPSKVSCQFAAYRGPVKLRADFKRGCVTFSLLSYEPVARNEASKCASA